MRRQAKGEAAAGGRGKGGLGFGRWQRWRLKQGGEERAAVRGVNPASGRVGQPAGAKRHPPRGRPMGGRGGAGKTEGAADARAQARGEREERLMGGAGWKEVTRN
jgi:hypothetical protein